MQEVLIIEKVNDGYVISENIGKTQTRYVRISVSDSLKLVEQLLISYVKSNTT